MRFKFHTVRAWNLTAEDTADRLEFIAGQIREGYTSGDAGGAGWWDVTDLAPDADDGEDEEA